MLDPKAREEIASAVEAATRSYLTTAGATTLANLDDVRQEYRWGFLDGYLGYLMSEGRRPPVRTPYVSGHEEGVRMRKAFRSR